jgi:hypothetical protein
MIPTFSFAQSLRVIGQELERLGIEIFEVERGSENYVVRMKRNISTESLLKRFAKIIRGSSGSTEEVLSAGQAPEPIAFTSSDINWLDSYARSRRGGATHIMPDAQKISLGLRVIGDYLDRKRARSFAIWWSSASLISINYRTSENDNKCERLTADNLYDLGVHMYMRRSNRSARRP